MIIATIMIRILIIMGERKMKRTRVSLEKGGGQSEGTMKGRY